MPATFGAVSPTQPFTPALSQIPPGQPERPLSDPVEGPRTQPVTPNFGGEAWKRYVKKNLAAKDRLIQARGFLETCFEPDRDPEGCSHYACAADRDPLGCIHFMMDLLDGQSLYYDSD